MIKLKRLVLVTVITAMGLMLVACGDDEKSASKTKRTTEEVTTEEETEEVTTEEVTTEEETEEVTTEDDTEEVTTGLEGNVYTGSGYTFEINDDWTLQESTSVIEATVTYSGGADINQQATAVGFQTMSSYGEDDLSVYADALVSQYESMESVEVLGSNYSTLGNYDTFELDMIMESFGVSMQMKQIVIMEDGSIFVITTAAVEEEYANVVDAINDLVLTFTVM